MTSDMAKEILGDIELHTAQWTALKWHFKQKEKEANK